MIKIGDFNKLRATRQTDNGVYFVGKDPEVEILLPNKYIPDELYEDDEMELFVFKDHEGRLTATTQKPKVTVNKFGYLWCKDVTDFGAFLKWGLDKDLFIPFREQAERMKEGEKPYNAEFFDREDFFGQKMESANCFFAGWHPQTSGKPTNGMANEAPAWRRSRRFSLDIVLLRSY